MYLRLLNPLLSQSFFLFGPRGTGKTSSLRGLLPPEKREEIDLLNSQLANSYLVGPRGFHQHLESLPERIDWVVIDEVQKVPALLDVVHQCIESTGPLSRLKFALTGSSARKLKRGGANLLAGRAFLNNLHPLTHRELGEDFNLEHALRFGTLPKLFQLQQIEEKKEFLRTYAQTYLKEEVKEEQLVRRLEPFIKFLEVAAQCNGTVLNFSKMGRDVGTDQKAIERYFEILQDTLLGFFLQPFHFSVRRRTIQKAKFYFFDPGVKRALENTLSVPLTEGYSIGRAFEHFVILELHRFNDYLRKDFRFSYLRTKDGAEIDLIVERPGQSRVLVEIKSSKAVDPTDVRKFARIAKIIPNSKPIILCQEPLPRVQEKVRILPWQMGIEEILEV